MAYEQRDNSFSMFKNDRKDKKEHPDLSGKLMIDGKMFWINGWKKTDKNGNTFISGTARPVDADKNKAKETAKSYNAPIRHPMDEAEDEIPF